MDGQASNPPMREDGIQMTPKSAPPIMRTRKFGANATMVPEAIMSSVKESRTVRRSSRPVTAETNRLVRTAKMPDTEIVLLCHKAHPSH